MSSVQTKKAPRQINLDILRILACFMVVLIHAAPANWADLNGTTIAYNTYDSIARAAVPIFFMVSGALFLARPGGISLKKLYTSNILKLFTIYLTWTLFYAVCNVLESEAFALQNWSEAWALFLQGILEPKFHLWFLPTMIILYMAMPALYAIVHYDNARYLPYCTLLFLALAIITHSTGLIPNMTSDIPEVLARASIRLLGYSGYFLLGYWLTTLKYERIHIWQLLLVLAVVIAISIVGAHLFAAETGGKPTPIRLFLANFSLPILLEAALLFMIFQKLGPSLNARAASSTRFTKGVLALSTASLAIYVLHPFFLEHTTAFLGFGALTFSPWLAVPLRALITFVCCALIGLVLNKIPFVKKWLV